MDNYDTINHIEHVENQVVQLQTDTKVTRMITFRKHLHWTIKNYFDWAATAGEFEYSPVFKIDLGNIKEPSTFCLKIYPKGETEDAMGHISVYLENQNKADIVADYEHYLVKKDGSHLKIISEEKWQFKQYAARGTKNGIKLSILQKHQEEFLPNGNLTIGSLITIKLPESDSVRHSNLEKNVKMQKTMSECFARTYAVTNPENTANYEKLSDFTIFCGNNLETSFKCHKLILSIRSRVFDKMFIHNTTENKKNEVHITDISPATVRDLLNFMYTDNITEEMISEELLYAADKYEVHRLKAICEKELAAQMTVAKAIDIGIAAHLQGTDAFQEEVIRFMAKNWGKIKASKAYEKVKQYPDLLLKILSKSSDLLSGES